MKYIILTTLTLLGCHSSTNHLASITKVEKDQIKPHQCNSNELARSFFVLGKGQQKVSHLDLPKTKRGRSINSYPAKLASTVRIDMCQHLQNKALRLIRIIDSGISWGLSTISTEKAKVKALSEILNNEYQNFEIQINFESRIDNGLSKPTDQGVLIKGFKDSGKNFVVIARIRHTGSTVISSSFIGYHGQFIEGQLIDQLKCIPGYEGQWPLLSSFEFGKAKFKSTACEGRGTSGTVNYRLVELTVEDHSSEIPTMARGKSMVYDEKYIKNNFTNTLNHHNVCDSFVLKTKHADYAGTTNLRGFGGGACPKVVPGAPERNDSKLGTKYIIRYKTGKETSGITPESCWHPFVRCP